MAAPTNFLAPIPGMSLTVEKGNRPWEQPPQYTTTTEVVDFYTKQLTNIDKMEEIASILKRNVPIDLIVESMVTFGMMKGKHTVDAGMLVAPILVELIITIAEMYGVDYQVTAAQPARKSSLTEEEARQIVEEAEAKMMKAAEKKTGGKGLMAKGEQE